MDQKRWIRHHHSPETDFYILKGDGEEVYEPRFTYHPVRYVQVEGYPGEPTLNDLEGRVVHSALDLAGDFHCSNSLLNAIHQNVHWTLTNELYGMPLDCLHREYWAWIDPATVASSLYTRGYMPERLSRLIATIKEEIVPNFDITPEMLTHNQVVNVEGIGTSDFIYPATFETEWSKSQDKETLTRYISRALEILKNVGLEASGVTSPGDFGSGNEDNYARTVLEAEKLVNHISLTWYFLHTDYTSVPVSPRIAYLDGQNREAVVNIISGCPDYVEETRDGQKEDPQWISQFADWYVSEDGAKGRLAELHASGSYIVFHTHWWRLHRKGSKVGMKVLREVLHRFRSSYDNGVIWMK